MVTLGLGLGLELRQPRFKMGSRGRAYPATRKLVLVVLLSSLLRGCAI